MKPRAIAGRTALVTGASSGLGVDFARELARRSVNLIVVARRIDALESLAQELRAAHEVSVQVIGADLSLPTAASELYDRLSAAGAKVDILINNAGLGLYGETQRIPWAKEQGMLQIDVVTLTGLIKLLLPQMLERRFGYILNLSSIAAYQPSPLYATYGAAKTFVLYLSEALNHELRGSGVSVTAVSPGITATEFLKVSGQKATPYQRLVMMQSEDVVRISLDAMLAGKSSVVPGLVNSITAWFGRFSPRALSVPTAELLMKSNEAHH